MSEDEAIVEAAALVVLAGAGIPSDVQELLVRGNPDQNVAPGALLKALKLLLERAGHITERACIDARRAGLEEAATALDEMALSLMQSAWKATIPERAAAEQKVEALYAGSRAIRSLMEKTDDNLR